MNDIIINNKEDELALWIYSSSKSSGEISVSYKDSSHKDRIINIAEEIAWTGWEKRKLPLPDNVKFPLIMDKVIFEFPSDQEEFGTLLFDSIERNEEYIYYQVKAGDTITGISQKIYKTNKYVD